MLTTALALTLLLSPQESPPPRPMAVVPDVSAHADVLEPVQGLFDAIRARDAAAATALLDPDARLTVVLQNPEGGSRVIQLGPEQFARNLQPGPETLEEVMVAPWVAVDGDVAVVWTRYLFRVDGAITHCGVDHFDLVRRDGVWKIVNLTWNQRTTGCDEIEALLAGR